MKAGDVMVQRGTNHAWANRSTARARRLRADRRRAARDRSPDHGGGQRTLMLSRWDCAVGERRRVMNKCEICFTGSSVELEANDFVLRNYLSV